MPFRLFVLAILAATPILGGCRELPEPIGVGAHPADADAPVSRARYRSVTGDMRDYRIVTPKPWGQSNEQVAPQRK
ncbi:MAG: hypothetical protein KDJ37_00990 [Hyphomicrobiaceae bacterium]|nr:hypothetical protein [Hyphomicrobiaceae bacterium]